MVHASAMEGLDSGFKCDAQETRGLWIEPLPVEVLSDRHNVENSRDPMAKIWFGLEHLSVGYPTQNTNYMCIFFVLRNCKWENSGKRLSISPKAEAEHRDWVNSVVFIPAAKARS